MSSPLDCSYRGDVRRENGQETAACLLLAQTLGSAAEPLLRVEQAVCTACCAAGDQAHARYNPVQASLLYDRAQQHLRAGAAGPEIPGLLRLREEARYRLRATSNQVNHAPDALGVLGTGERRLPRVARWGQRLTWAVAVLTAPRNPMTLPATLHSLQAAGFDNLHLFAEPDTVIPAGFAAVPQIRHARHQGPLRNFCFAAQTLLTAHPHVDCYAIFEDDLSVASGLRNWCDEQFWPGGHGLVSLYTSRAVGDSQPGWQTLNLGRYRTFGALAFVFRGPTLRAFLDDAEVGHHLESGKLGADAVVGEWALRRGLGLAYHSPSLIQHEGQTTSLAGHALGRVGRAEAVGQVSAIASWQPPAPRPGQVGLIGWNTRTGLGYQNRDLAVHLPVARWLAPPHPQYPTLPGPRMPGAYWAPWSQPTSTQQLRAWLQGLDWLLFVEHPYLPGVVRHAREMGISVACVPNWEWLTVDADWLPYVDLMICPTLWTYRMLCQWRRDLGFAWEVVHVPWPIDPGRFPYRRRDRCDTFLFVNGTGGCQARRVDGSVPPYHRKGVELLAATARLLRSVPFLLYSQETDLPALPGNVEVQPPPDDNRLLYERGDVCVQPSHWEGLGLQLLECQAAGLPLVTTAAAPMMECRPFRTVPVAGTELVFVHGDQPVDANLMHPEVLAETLHAIHGADLRQASEEARRYIEQERSWSRLRATIAGWLPA